MKNITDIILILLHVYNYKFIITVFSYTSAGVILLIVHFPDILDFIAPLNVSRIRKIPMDVEYFIDEQKYFHIIAYHLFIWVIVGITISISTETVYIVYVNHICGMFKIAR